jgi:hypothetical protein
MPSSLAIKIPWLCCTAFVQCNLNIGQKTISCPAHGVSFLTFGVMVICARLPNGQARATALVGENPSRACIEPQGGFRECSEREPSAVIAATAELRELSSGSRHWIDDPLKRRAMQPLKELQSVFKANQPSGPGNTCADSY